MSTVQSIDSSVYYKEKYWDAFPQAKRYIHFQTTGYKTRGGLEDFKKKFAQKPFKHGLFLNCGNGWLERWFIENGVVKKATGFDCSEELLAEAERKKKKLPIKYFKADANTIELPENKYDLVVNSAALHHVQFINRFCYQIAKSMTANGVFSHFDYIGPRRNQYSARDWQLIQDVNNSLPKSIRKEPLSYPHLPTMMVMDPSEAIHSDLILESVGRYFDIIEQHNISGMIAYNLLSLNPKLRRGQQNKSIERIIEADKQAFAAKQIQPLFTYMVVKPNKQILTQTKKVKLWQLAENLRERDSKFIEWTYSIGEYWKLIEHSQKKKRITRLGCYLGARALSGAQLLMSHISATLS
jgi:ubiquinone/menaquinone biosynthesis C-methylase UbiE